MRLIKKGNSKYSIYLLLLYVILPFIILSCGILDVQSGMHPTIYSTKEKIYTINTDDTNIKFLAYGSDPKFSKDGNKIYFNNGGLCSMNVDGTSQQQILSKDVVLWDYTISNDGSEIVASTFQSLYLIKNNTSTFSLFFSATDNDFCTSPSISSNDSIVVFQNRFNISSVNSDGRNEKNIYTSDSAHEYYQPVFTSDGNNFLYEYRNYFNEYFIRYSNFQNNSLSNIFTYPNFHDNTSGREDLKISPNDVIIFAALASQSNNTFYIHQINLADRNDKILTEGYDVNYSFDYSELTYLKPNDPNKAIYIYNLSSGDISKIKTNLQWAKLFHPQLSLNNKFLVFEADSTYVSYQY